VLVLVLQRGVAFEGRGSSPFDVVRRVVTMLRPALYATVDRICGISARLGVFSMTTSEQ